MAPRWTRDGIPYHRPLLAVPGAEIRVWLAQQNTAFVEDPSNSDEHFTRNQIRARLLPALQACFPHFRSTVARSAMHAAQAQDLLLEVAQQDLAQIGAPPTIKLLQGLSRPRQANLLRHWLSSCHQATPSAAQLNELLRQIDACRTRGHGVSLKIGQGFCERRGPKLHWYNPQLFSLSNS